MKKTLSAIVLAVLALTACNSEKISVTEPAQLPETGGFKVDIKINRDDVPDTKAYVKSSFATNDVVFIFFSNVDAPKYLEAKHTGAGTWTFTAKNGLTSADLEGTLVKQMTAIYMPYGSNFTVGKQGSAFDFGPIYFGYILQAEQVAYTITDNVLSGSITLTAPALHTNENYIHFDIQGFTSGHSYELSQAFVKCGYLNYINSLARVFYDEDSYPAGSSLYGYEDGSNMTFSGVLVADAYNTELDYQFTIIDRTDNIIYTRDAGLKTLNSSKYIGLGDISTSAWKATEYVDLGLPSHAMWAKCNLGADAETGYGDYYAWGETETYYSSLSPLTMKQGKEAGHDWGSYFDNPTGDGNTFTKYSVSALTELQREDDVATANLKGMWRIPTMGDYEELFNSSYCDLTWQADYNGTGVKGYLVTSKMAGHIGAQIFLPAADFCYLNYAPGVSSNYGYYWSRTLDDAYSQSAYLMYFAPSDYWISSDLRSRGQSIRPVCVLP